MGGKGNGRMIGRITGLTVSMNVKVRYNSAYTENQTA